MLMGLLTVSKQECVEGRKPTQTYLPNTPGLIRSENENNDVKQY